MNRKRLELQEGFWLAGPGGWLCGVRTQSLEGTWYPGGCLRTQPLRATGRETKWLRFIGCVLLLILASLSA
jgi:hypothetical protein